VQSSPTRKIIFSASEQIAIQKLIRSSADSLGWLTKITDAFFMQKLLQLSAQEMGNLLEYTSLGMELQDQLHQLRAEFAKQLLKKQGLNR